MACRFTRESLRDLEGNGLIRLVDPYCHLNQLDPNRFNTASELGKTG